MKKLTCCEKAYIRGLRDGGMEAKKIAEKTGVSLSGVYRVISIDEEDQSTKSERPVGRPEKLSERDKRAFVITAKKNKHATLGEITNSRPNQVCENTVRKVLHNANLKNRIVKKNPKHIKTRH